MQNNPEELLEFALLMGDNALILGHRLSEWTGHGPALEQDIAITNISLDQVGQARSWLQFAGELEGKGRSEDDLAYQRLDREFRNYLLLELPKGDWAFTIVRQFLFDLYNFELHRVLSDSAHKQVAAIAAKSLKEITYHLRYSSEWMIRLGDGTELSNQKMQAALEEIWRFRGELFEDHPVDQKLAELGISVLPSSLQGACDERMRTILEKARLQEPDAKAYRTGGRKGMHTEHLGYILAVMQSVQRAYPGLEW